MADSIPASARSSLAPHPTPVVVVTDVPTPYRDPLWAAWSDLPEVDPLICYMAHSEVGQDWEPAWRMPPRHLFLPGRTWRPRPDNPFALKWNPRLWKVLSAERPEMVVVGSWGQPTSWIAMLWCRAHGVPYVIQCESHLLDPRPWWVRAAKQVLVRLAVSGQAAGLPTGSLARECMAHYGAERSRLFRFPNSPDAEALARRCDAWSSRRSELREKLDLAGREVILFVGRLVPVKGVDLLIDAMARLRERRPASLAVIVGEGEERPPLEGRIRRLGLEEDVRMVGFVEPQELVRWYAAADLFCLPSRFEPWGAVVNEAMACRLPVVLSDRVGAGYDLLTPDCGRMVRSGDPDDLARALASLLALGKPERRRAGDEARRRALDWGHPRCLESLEAARRASLAGRAARDPAP